MGNNEDIIKKRKDIIITIFIAVLTLVLLLIVTNQAIKFIETVKYLNNPCSFCLELNPQFTCLNNTIINNIYTTEYVNISKLNNISYFT